MYKRFKLQIKIEITIQIIDTFDNFTGENLDQLDQSAKCFITSR
jgi:hypothetical protein